MDKDFADHLNKCSLEAISSLSRILTANHDKCSEQEYEKIKRGVGLSIGQIQMDLIEMAYREFPEMDDLK